MFSPKNEKRAPKDFSRSPNPFSDASAPYLPTPVTVGTGKKVRQFANPIEPSRKSRSLTASLQALADEGVSQVRDNAFLLETNTSLLKKCILRTPSPRPVERGSENVSDSDDDIQIVSVADLDKIPRYKMENPFIENEPTSHHQLLPQSIDLSTHMELINHRTGKKIVNKLSEEERKFKPRKLVFTRDVAPVAVDYNIANKFIDKNIGNKFTLGTDASSYKPNFSIFSDSEEN